MNVPFLDLKAQYASIEDEVNAAIQDVLTNTAFAGGPFVSAFEEAFAPYCETKHAIGVSSGTSAIWLALLAMDVGPGDEVITTPNTFIATAEAISFCGATPVFVDIDEKTHNIDPAKIEAAITPRTKVIIPVHLFGQMADMDPIIEIARRHHLLVLEDASQAHGAEYKGRRAGSIGDVGTYSFYPGKNLGAYGEAGAVVTNDPVLAERIDVLRNHGQEKKYHHKVIGWNGRMDGIQGAVLSVKMNHIEAWTEDRRTHARQYDELLADAPGVIAPIEAAYGRHVYHLYAVRVQQRDVVLRRMGERGVSCGIHYPIPLHVQPAYESLGYTNGQFPISEQTSREYLSLPMYPELTPEQVAYAASCLKEEVAAVAAEENGSVVNTAAI